MNEHIKKMKEKRIGATQKIQQKYNSLNNYVDKFAFVYDLIYENMHEYAKYSKREFIFNNREYLIELSKNIKSKGDFINLIKEKLIIPLNNGHCFMYNHYNEKIVVKSNMLITNDNFNYDFIFEDTVYLSFKSFKRDYLADDKIKFEYLNKKIVDKEINNIIIDIRGNRGGSDDYLLEILNCFQMSLNYKIEWYNLLFDEIENYECNYNYGNKKYNIYILVDNEVFSAAECITRAFKQNRAIIIGEETRGEAGMSPQLELNILTYINSDTKKETNLMLQIPIEAPVNEQGEIDYNYTNTKPTIKCKKEDALEIVLSKIKENRI